MLLTCSGIVWPVPAIGPDPCPVAGRQPRGEREMSRQAAGIAHAAGPELADLCARPQTIGSREAHKFGVRLSDHRSQAPRYVIGHGLGVGVQCRRHAWIESWDPLCAGHPDETFCCAGARIRGSADLCGRSAAVPGYARPVTPDRVRRRCRLAGQTASVRVQRTWPWRGIRRVLLACRGGGPWRRRGAGPGSGPSRWRARAGRLRAGRGARVRRGCPRGRR